MLVEFLTFQIDLYIVVIEIYAPTGIFMKSVCMFSISECFFMLVIIWFKYLNKKEKYTRRMSLIQSPTKTKLEMA